MENEKEKPDYTLEKANPEEHTLTEEISNIGQIIVGELESIGGVITANPTARAEGDLRADEAIIREKITHDLSEEDETEGIEK
jgi:hypothetical protein